MNLNIPWDEINAIKYRLDFPMKIPGKSWWAVQREDIRILIKIIERASQLSEAATKADSW